jgi:hypothetical protein
MSLVHARVAEVDPEQVCDECGVKLGDHKVSHRPQGIVKGLKGECPICHGPMHNKNDSLLLSQFKCVWQQVFKGTNPEITADNLAEASVAVRSGSAVVPGDKTKLFAPPAPAVVATAPKAAAAAAPATSVGAYSGTPAVAAPAVSTPSVPATPTTPAAAPVGASDEEKKARKAAVRAALKTAKVNP